MIVEKFASFPSEIQDLLRSGLLNVAVARYKNIKTMGTLGLLIREILELDNKVKDGFNEWIDPMGEMIKWMGLDEGPGIAEAGNHIVI